MRGGSSSVTPPPPPPSADNVMTLTNVSGSALTNYPLQFGRPFVAGEIANYPQVLINGTPAATQADVKNRYTDGSCKYAIISVIVPSLPSATPVTLTFQNEASGNNTSLSTSQMLAAGYNFDCQLALTFPAAVQGMPNATVATWKAITNGSLAFTYDGTPYEITGMNFSAVANTNDIAAVITAKVATEFGAGHIPGIRTSVTRVPGFNLNWSRIGGPDTGIGHRSRLLRRPPAPTSRHLCSRHRYPQFLARLKQLALERC